MQLFNADQLDHLAKFWFDISKGAILLAFFPSENAGTFPSQLFTSVIYFIAGTISIMIGLKLLKNKEQLT